MPARTVAAAQTRAPAISIRDDATHGGGAINVPWGYESSTFTRLGRKKRKLADFVALKVPSKYEPLP
jgi:hypothetical protein